MILREAAENGLGVALLPSFCLGSAVSSGALVRLLPDHLGPERNLYIAYEADSMRPRRIRLFVEYMVERLKTPPWELFA